MCVEKGVNMRHWPWTVGYSPMAELFSRNGLHSYTLLGILPQWEFSTHWAMRCSLSISPEHHRGLLEKGKIQQSLESSQKQRRQQMERLKKLKVQSLLAKSSWCLKIFKQRSRSLLQRARRSEQWEGSVRYCTLWARASSLCLPGLKAQGVSQLRRALTRGPSVQSLHSLSRVCCPHFPISI